MTSKDPIASMIGDLVAEREDDAEDCDECNGLGYEIVDVGWLEKCRACDGKGG